jgi:hypothetical protein
VDPQDDNPPEPSETASKADRKPPVEDVPLTRASWAETHPLPPSADGAELELPLVTTTFDPQTEPELPLDAAGIEALDETTTTADGPVDIEAASEATVDTQATSEGTVDTQASSEGPIDTQATSEGTVDTQATSEGTVDIEAAAKATVDVEPKAALPMQKQTPSWTQGDPPADEPVGVEDETEPKPAVPMQKPAPVWAQTVPAPAEEHDADPEPTPPAQTPRSAPLSWPPKDQADAELPTQSDIWPPEPPTEPAMPAWPPKMIEDAESQLPNLPSEPTPSEWNPTPVAPHAAGESSPPQAATVPPATVPPAPVPPAAAPPQAATVPPAGRTPTAVPPATSTPTVPVSAAVPPAGGDQHPAAEDPAAAQPGITHGSALPAVGKKGRWQSWSSRPPEAPTPTAKDLAAAKKPEPEKPIEPEKPVEPEKPAEPTWAPTLVMPKKKTEPSTDWPGVVDVPAWAPHIRSGAAPPASSAPVPQPQPPAPTAPTPKPPEPVVPAASAPPPQPAASTSGGSPAWAVVEQKQVDTAKISREIPSPEDRSYAEWFAWAKRGGAPAGACHAAAQAAFQALASGKDVAVAAQLAAAAMAKPPLAVDIGRQTYCAWFSLGNIDLAFDQRRAHAFATAAVHALDAGGDAKQAHAAGLDAAGIK